MFIGFSLIFMHRKPFNLLCILCLLLLYFGFMTTRLVSVYTERFSLWSYYNCILSFVIYSGEKVSFSSSSISSFKDLYSTAPKRGSVFIGLMTPDGAIWSRYQRIVLMR